MSTKAPVETVFDTEKLHISKGAWAEDTMEDDADDVTLSVGDGCACCSKASESGDMPFPLVDRYMIRYAVNGFE